MTVDQGSGPDPLLPDPDPQATPVINVSQDVGWPARQVPVASSGFRIREFAGELDHPRWLYVLPNGDVLVAETNAPARPDVHGSVEGVVVNTVKYYIGTGGESADRITLLRDTDGDGKADMRSVFLDNLNSPFGMVLVDDMFYVANTDALWRFPYTEGVQKLSQSGEKVVDQEGAFVALHGSYNRIPKSGYRVIFVPFVNGQPQGLPEDIITGFLNTDSEARGRPAGLAFVQDGALLIADDTGDKIWNLQAEEEK